MTKQKSSGGEKMTTVQGIEMTEEDARRFRDSANRFRERIVSIVHEYSLFVLTPRILAEKRRREGDPAASPADYDCLCDLDRTDSLPICDAKRENCKFRDRARPPGIRYRDNWVKYWIARAEQAKILEELHMDDVEAYIAEVSRMDKAVKTALRRIEKTTGIEVERSKTGWW